MERKLTSVIALYYIQKLIKMELDEILDQFLGCHRPKLKVNSKMIQLHKVNMEENLVTLDKAKIYIGHKDQKL